MPQGIPTLVFVPGSWHRPTCYSRIIKPLQDEHHIKRVAITLPSTTDNPKATFKDDIDAARDAILSETTQGRDVIVVAHSYGGMVGNSAIRGLTASPKSGSSSTTTDAQPSSDEASSSQTRTATSHSKDIHGHVKALILIASGFTITGLSFMDPLLGLPLPFFRSDKDSGYATLTVNPSDLFYHDLSDDDAAYWVGQLTTQSLKSLYEGGEHAYGGWQDVPTWYVGTIEDRGLPVIAQRVQVGAARSLGATVHHFELRSSHSPFLSMPGEVVDIIMQAVWSVSGVQEKTTMEAGKATVDGARKSQITPMVKLIAPSTWFTYGLPSLIGRSLGLGFRGFMFLRAWWTRK